MYQCVLVTNRDYNLQLTSTIQTYSIGIKKFLYTSCIHLTRKFMVSLEYKRDMQALFEQEGDISSNDGTRKHFDDLLHTEHYNM